MQSNYLWVLYTEGMIPYTVTVVALNGAPQPGEPRTETFFTEEGGLHSLVLQWFKFYALSSSSSLTNGCLTTKAQWYSHEHQLESNTTDTEQRVHH